MNRQETLIAGVDEAGRGPWAGPVVAAAVILPNQHEIVGLADSKKLSEKKRRSLEKQIKQQALAWSVVSVSAKQIDQTNILQATLKAMSQAIEELAVRPTRVLVDGNQAPPAAMPVETLIKGDGKIAAISAASILAKVYRDLVLRDLDQQFPNYGFAKHKGYGTAAHRQKLIELGPCAIHRHSFKPVRLAQK